MDTDTERSKYEAKFDRRELNSAGELLNALRLSNLSWFPAPQVQDNEWVRSWYFRGQRDANWHLIPSSWRSPSNEPIELGKKDSALYRSRVNQAINDVKGRRDKNGL